MSRRSGLLASLGLLAVACAACSSTASSTSIPTSSPTSAPTVTGPGGALGGSNDVKTAAVTLPGTGSESIEPFYAKVLGSYHAANANVTAPYTATGSAAGIAAIQQATVAFGQSEVPIAPPSTGRAGVILQVPVALGGVAVSYNLGASTPQGLKLDGSVLSGIYQGTITKWNDPAIKALNPKVSLPDLAIVAVHRTDASGPNWDLDRYLILTSPSWKAKVGDKASSTWPLPAVGTGQALDTGVAAAVAHTAGAIGFLGYAVALKQGLPTAALENQAGNFVTPAPKSIRKAAGKASTLSYVNFSVVDQPGGQAYPLVNYSWALVYQKQTDQNTGIAIGKMLDWVATTGQYQSKPLGYAPMPLDAVLVARETLTEMQNAAGQPLFSH